MPRVTETFTLTAIACLRDLLKSVSNEIAMNLTYLQWRTKTGGPVAKGSSTMVTQADGDSYAVDEGDTEHAFGTDRIDATQVYFLPSASGDKIFIEARSA